MWSGDKFMAILSTKKSNFSLVPLFVVLLFVVLL